MTQQLEQQPGVPVDIEEAENKASEDVVADREEKLAAKAGIHGKSGSPSW